LPTQPPAPIWAFFMFGFCLRGDLPGMVAEVMREVVREQR
jgi:hypothetical protein